LYFELQVPDELGYLEPIREYINEDVELSLPGELTIFDIRWFSIYDTTNKRDLGHIIIPGKFCYNNNSYILIHFPT
jgi:hypothetical protein